jgi:multiple sugar transport system permease protein
MAYRTRRAAIEHAFLYVLLALLAVVSLAPFLWALSSSLKSEAETFDHPYSWIPKSWDWLNYVRIFQRAPLGLHFFNTLIYGAGQVALALLIAPMAGYALARKSFPGRNAIFIFIIALMIIPRQATIVHLFVLIRNFPLAGGNNILGAGGKGLVDTFAGLILPRAVDPFSIFIMRQFFWSLPKDLESAARIDGATEWRTYWKIFFPMAAAGLSVIIIFSFEEAWNDFLWPLILLYDKAKYTVQLGLMEFRSDTGALWAQLMAATVVVSVPMVALFLAFQKYFFKGISFAGINK